MPSLPMYKISAPSDAKEFENILMDYSGRIYGGRSTLLGRNGQAQHGVDVVVTRDDSSIICVQCKDVTQKAVTRTNIDNWIEEAEQSIIPMVRFVIAVASYRDATIQEYVYSLSQKRVLQGKIPVEIVFWEDIEHFLKLNKDFLQLYYPYLANQQIGTNAENSNVLIKAPYDLKNAFLNEFVKYHVREYIEVDIFVGFPYDFAVMCDQFELSVQQIMYRAIMLRDSDMYHEITQFMNALHELTSCWSSLAELVNEKMVRVIAIHIRNEQETYNALIDMLRTTVLKHLDTILDF